MANHVRQQIRERVASVLTGLTTTGSNVFQSRIYPLEKSNLPCLSIYTQEEQSRPVELGNEARTISRVLKLRIDGVARATSDIDDILDTIAKEVETAMANDVVTGGLSKGHELTETIISLFGDGEQPVGIVSLLYDIQYFNQENTPDVAE